MKIKLPQVHWSVNLAGLAAVVGSAVGYVAQNPSCVAGVLPANDALAATAVAGAIAAFLPAKGAGTPKSPNP